MSCMCCIDSNLLNFAEISKCSVISLCVCTTEQAIWLIYFSGLFIAVATKLSTVRIVCRQGVRDI
jgi:hypothetical protein